MSAETFGVSAQPKALAFFHGVVVGDLPHQKNTYKLFWMESTAWSYSLSIILRAPTANPNLHDYNITV